MSEAKRLCFCGCEGRFRPLKSLKSLEYFPNFPNFPTFHVPQCGNGQTELGRNTASLAPDSAFFSIENEQADKRRDSQTCLAKPNSQARTEAREIFQVQLTINRIGNLSQLICTLLYVMTTHAYVYTVL